MSRFSKRAVSASISVSKTRGYKVRCSDGAEEDGESDRGRSDFWLCVFLGNALGETRDPDIRIHCRRHVTSNQPGHCVGTSRNRSMVLVDVLTRYTRAYVDVRVICLKL